MTREQAINYLFSSGFTNEQVSDVVRALTYEPITKNDLGVDCISRQGAIDAIRRIHPIDTDYDCTLFDKDDVMYVLNDLPSVTPQEPRWIPVSERLPDKNVWVLVTVEQSGMCHQEIMRRNKYIEAWTDNIDNYTDEITAWMPLPQPYSEVEE